MVLVKKQMKAVGLVMCIFITGSYFAQEVNHLKGTEPETESSENAIQEISEKRIGLEMEVSVYPNPSEGRIFIEGKNGSSITLYSLEGTYVGSWVIGLEEKVEITDLPQGTFVCMITEGQNRISKKIVVL